MLPRLKYIVAQFMYHGHNKNKSVIPHKLQIHRLLFYP